MTIRQLRSVLLTALPALLAPAAASANDSEAHLVGGAIVLRKSTHISMEEEELRITPDSVIVRYRFRNHSRRPVVTRVAFPIRSRVEPDDVGSIDGYVASLGFSAIVDGSPLAVEHTVRRTRDSIQVTFHWPMTFPASGTVIVEHRYAVRGGSILPPGDWDRSYWKRFAREYCLDDSTLAAIRRHPGSIRPVPYVLHTGGNWRGPIGRFRLVVESHGSSTIVAACPLKLERAGDTTYVFERRNYRPVTDLDVAFISTAEPDAD